MGINRKQRLIYIIFIGVILFGANLIYNSWINEGIRTLYLDDLGNYLSFKEKGNLEYIFNTDANKNRVLLNAIYVVIFNLIGQNFEILDNILMILNWVIAIGISLIICSLCKNKEERIAQVLGLAGGVCYIASRFSYYEISEVFGIMENIALIIAILILFLLINYINKQENKYYYIASLLYFMILYVHERYIVLIGVFVIASVLKNKKNIKEHKILILPLLILIFFWGIRFLLFGNRVLDGTGGTDINETLNIYQVIEFSISQIAYILGINCGPEYLNGILFTNVPLKINILIGINIVVILITMTLFIKTLFEKKELVKKYLPIMLLIITFIGCCIISSSITIRVEMRWIYVSYTAFLIMECMMISVVLMEHKKTIWIFFLIFVQFISIQLYETYYRQNYKNIYYWQNRDLSYSLYDITIGSYGENFEDFQTILVGMDSLQWDEDGWKQFFSPYIEPDNLQFIHINKIEEIINNKNALSDKTIVLTEDKKHREYVDISDLLK